MPTNLRHTRLGGRVGSLYAATGATPAGGGALDYPTRWGLVSYWKLEEASGTRADSHGTNPLTDNNTVTQTTGKLTNAAQFTAANSEYLSIPDNASLSTGDVDFAWGGWFWLDTKPANVMGLVTARELAIGDDGIWLVWNNGSDRVQWAIWDATGTLIGNVSATTFGAPATVTWYFIMVYHDAVNNQVGISVNGGVFDTAATTGAPADATKPVEIGRDANVAGRYLNGRADSVFFLKSPPGGIAALTTEIRDRLYNAGSGREYPFS